VDDEADGGVLAAIDAWESYSFVDTEGAVDPSAGARAVVQYVRSSLGDAKASRLRVVLEDDSPNVPECGAVARPANATPWAHLRRLIDRL
jgi:hypothetical protein